MNNTILKDETGTVAYYAVLLNGRVVSPKFTDRFAAEQHKMTLPKTHQAIAEVCPVDQNNRQLLLG